MKRRDFLRQTAAAAAVTCCPGQSVGQQARPGESRHPARHWQGLASQRVRCTLCPRACTMGPGERGYCGVRKNEGGRLMTLVHSRPCSLRSDPIEKKPLFHYLPGTDSFSLATAGCNLACQFCQNWRISQFRPSEVASVHLTPRQVVDRARAAGARSIAFTYSEPIVFYEYMYDIARLAHEAGLGRVMISNGYITPPPLRELLALLDGVKIDLKAFRQRFYRDVCEGELRPVLNSLREIRRQGVWLEIVVLIIPSLNDSDAEMRAMSRWLLQQLGPDVPLHLSRFHPTYRLTNIPRTPVRTIERLRNIAQESGLRYVYLGNVPGHPGEQTSCPGCGRPVIERTGHVVRANRLRQGLCPHCSHSLAGHWS